MFKTIAWATDGSELADRALPIVTTIARAHGSRIVVFRWLTELSWSRQPLFVNVTLI